MRTANAAAVATVACKPAEPHAIAQLHLAVLLREPQAVAGLHCLPFASDELLHTRLAPVAGPTVSDVSMRLQQAALLHAAKARALLLHCSGTGLHAPAHPRRAFQKRQQCHGSVICGDQAVGQPQGDLVHVLCEIPAAGEQSSVGERRVASAAFLWRLHRHVGLAWAVL